jgi:curved DNA-binding protein CbpA
MSRDDHDLYAVLGVTPDASQDQISHAYRRLVRAHHPDIQPEPDSAALAAAVAAAAILRDPTRRAAYDRSRHPTPDQQPALQPVPQRYRSVPDIRAGPVRWHGDPHRTPTRDPRPSA